MDCTVRDLLLYLVLTWFYKGLTYLSLICILCFWTALCISLIREENKFGKLIPLFSHSLCSLNMHQWQNLESAGLWKYISYAVAELSVSLFYLFWIQVTTLHILKSGEKIFSPQTVYFSSKIWLSISKCSYVFLALPFSKISVKLLWTWLCVIGCVCFWKT